MTDDTRGLVTAAVTVGPACGGRSLCRGWSLFYIEAVLVLYFLTQFSMNIIGQRYVLDWVKKELTASDLLRNVSHGNGTTSPCQANISQDEYAFEERIQSVGSHFAILRSMVWGVPALVVTALLGACSDRYGRRLAVVPPLVGLLLSSTILTLVLRLNQSIYILLVGDLLYGLGGSYASLTMGGFSYVADRTSPQRRMIRITLVEMCMLTPGIISPIALGPLVDRLGLVNTMYIISVICFVNLVYTLCFMRGDLTVRKQVSTDSMDHTDMDKERNYSSPGENCDNINNEQPCPQPSPSSSSSSPQSSSAVSSPIRPQGTLPQPTPPSSLPLPPQGTLPLHPTSVSSDTGTENWPSQPPTSAAPGVLSVAWSQMKSCVRLFTHSSGSNPSLRGRRSSDVISTGTTDVISPRSSHSGATVSNDVMSTVSCDVISHGASNSGVPRSSDVMRTGSSDVTPNLSSDVTPLRSNNSMNMSSDDGVISPAPNTALLGSIDESISRSNDRTSLPQSSRSGEENQPPYSRRLKLNLLLLAFFLSILPSFDFTIEPLFQMNSPLCWDVRMIGLYSGLSMGVATIGGMICAPLLKLRLHDSSIALIASLALISSSAYKAFVTTTLMMMLATSVNMLSVLLIPSIRSLMSSLVSEQEQGAVFGVIGCVELVGGIVGTLIFNSIYSATLPIFTGLVYLVMSSFYALSAAILLLYKLLMYTQSRGSEYRLIVNE